MILPGIGGHLLPTRFIAEHITPTASCQSAKHWDRWWRRVSATCGPATGLRALFDEVAMPLFGRLGYRARRPQFDAGSASVTLLTPHQHPIGLLLRPWAERPPTLWRDALIVARRIGAEWCFVLAPPHLSLLPTTGHVTRRALDFTLPLTIQPASLDTFVTLTHAAALEPDPQSRLSEWLRQATTEHARVKTDLQRGVLEALAELTTVLTRSPTTVPPRDEALTMVYRILFLLFAESRNLVPHDHPVYREAYTLSSLCDAAMRSIPARGVWNGLAAISRLSRHGGRVGTLEVFPFNGRLFAADSAPTLERSRQQSRSGRASDARDLAVSRALVALGTRREPTGRVRISYADLGVEELGAVYERVLDWTAPGQSHARKDTGTFYTPQALADLVIHRTLGPLVEQRSADGILDLRVVDPAMGSGAFLVAALRYLTDAYERALVREGRCASSEVTAADRAIFRRSIAQRCLFGVDLNPVAVQVARLSLWLATLAHERPLSFLDHRLRSGNSLIGATPADIHRAPGATTHTLPLFDDARSQLELTMRSVLPTLSHIMSQPDDTVAAVRRKESAWAHLQRDSHPLTHWHLAVSLWCAQWFWPAPHRRPSPAEIRAAARAIVNCEHETGANTTTAVARYTTRWAALAEKAATAQSMFHWPLEFPDAFFDSSGHPRPDAGFDAVVGNPPWEMIRRDSTSGRRGSGRDPLVKFVRESGLFPRCQRGHLNLYQPFMERSLSLLRPGGRLGLIVPWGFAVDDGSAALRTALFESGAIDTIVGLDNGRGLFPIHRGLRFAVVVAQPGRPVRDAGAVFGVKTTEELEDLTTHDGPLPVRLEHSRLGVVGGRSCRVPDVRQPDDLRWLAGVMQSHPALGSPEGWHAQFSRELNATDDRAAFTLVEGRGRLPVADGKHIEPFVVHVDHCRRFLTPAAALKRLPDRRYTAPRLAYRDVSGVGNRLTLIAAVMPADVVTTHTLFCLRNKVSILRQHFLCGIFNSQLMNRVVRLLMGSHVTTSLVEQLPVPVWRHTPGHLRIATTARALATSRVSPERRALLVSRLNRDINSLYSCPR